MAGSYIIYICVCVGGWDEDLDGKPNSQGGGLRRHRQIILERYTLNLHLGYQTIFDEDVEDTCLISDGRALE